MHEHACVCIGGCLVSSSITVHLIIIIIIFFLDGFSLSIVFSNLTLAADQSVLGILLSPFLHLWDYRFEYLYPAQLFV